MLTLWTAAHRSTPALCSGELASSAHPPGHSLLFALLKGEVSEGRKQKGFHYIQLKIREKASPSSEYYSVKYLLPLLSGHFSAEALLYFVYAYE